MSQPVRFPIVGPGVDRWPTLSREQTSPPGPAADGQRPTKKYEAAFRQLRRNERWCPPAGFRLWPTDFQLTGTLNRHQSLVQKQKRGDRPRREAPVRENVGPKKTRKKKKKKIKTHRDCTAYLSTRLRPPRRTKALGREQVHSSAALTNPAKRPTAKNSLTPPPTIARRLPSHSPHGLPTHCPGSTSRKSQPPSQVAIPRHGIARRRRQLISVAFALFASGRTAARRLADCPGPAWLPTLPRRKQANGGVTLSNNWLGLNPTDYESGILHYLLQIYNNF